MAQLNFRVDDTADPFYSKQKIKHLKKAVNDFNKRTGFIHNEHDLNEFKEYERKKKAGKIKTRPINELWKELEL